MLDLRPVGYIIGLMLAVLGALMTVPMAVDALAGNPNWWAFLESAFISGSAGVFLALTNSNALGRSLTLRQAFLVTVGIWAFLPLFGALPFMLGGPRAGFTDAYFEAVSGITTTGSTVFVGLDDFPPGLNLWRGMLNWTGGLGIAFLAMIFLPVMRVGGMQFFRTEGFDTLGKILPRAADIARSLAQVYAGLTFACLAVYLLVGMTPLDAVVNAMATIATGGFSPSDVSFGKYQGAGEYAGALFMILGSLPYIRYVQLVNGSARPLWRDPQVRAYLRWTLYAVGSVTLWRIATSDMAPEPAFREALFNLVSIISSTGFFSGSFPGWGSYMMAVAFWIGIIGACSGSSAAGLSVFRVQLMGQVVIAQIRRLHAPHRVALVKYDGRSVDEDTLNALVMYIYGYVVTLGVLTVLLTFFGVDMESALFGVWTSIGNIGYGFGPMVARTGTFVDFPDAAKWVMIVAMLMGRLGLLSLFVLVLPRFWRS
ncbi:potassium transporter TrkH [Frigidibacter albus]|uniref:Trk system potassium uptake protein n=1 Tax=Frigidibacter albus TaxID=1465486 RepID=A0A6L8VLM6_9RHOB|nr:TrkH family potassium uptake protein [Frigidibacter albus]MZQ90060.1 potassium transporter TrkH [Frigidibacter albus]NBE31968.1 potassium transporter TrkH [Frigidibacter albus]GGH57584.1 Trk system potassium uptake protein [Frigidibacter albus]